MDYYRVSISTENVGCYPQSESMTEGYQYKAEDSVWNLGQDYNLAPNLNAIELKSKAKLTDLLSCVSINSYIAQIISQKLSTLLAKFELPSHQLHKAEVIKNQRSIGGYFLFMITENSETQINFEKSSFIIKRRGAPILRTLDINSFEEFDSIYKSKGLLKVGETVRIRKLFFNEKMKYDILRFDRLFGYVVNEKLKMALEEKEITGVDFEKIDLNDPR